MSAYEPATTGDLLEAINRQTEAVTALVVSTPEACRRLAIGPNQLARLVSEGAIRRIPHLHGRGGAHQYAVTELERFVQQRMQTASDDTAAA
ncbi:MAG: helix-turn-helix domain-containing protein [Ilumatobacteraceae bacterium]